MLEQWEVTGNLGVGRTQVKPIVLLPSWDSQGNPRCPWEVSGVTPDEQAAAGGAAEESGKVAEETEQGRREGTGRKNTTRQKGGRWKGLVQTAQRSSCHCRSCTASPNGISNIPSPWRPTLKGSPSVQYLCASCWHLFCRKK